MTGDGTAVDWSVFTGVPLLRTVATALMQLSRRREASDPVYDDAVQRAFNQLVLACLRRGVEPPGSVPVMVKWASDRSVGGWPLDLPAEATTAAEFLVDAETMTPTQSCAEWALSAPDATAEQFEQLLMEEAIAACRAARSPETYTAFRRLLITRPVLTSAEVALLAEDIDFLPVHHLVKKSYEPAPAAYQREGRFVTCARCRCLMLPVGRDGLRCELDRCRREGAAGVERALAVHEGGGVHQLVRPLRMFITGPGIAEIDLETELVRLGLTPEMWPEFDAYDLRVPLPDGRVWAIDVKDRANPALLRRATRPFRSSPPFDQAFLVVPRYRFAEREDYQRVFEHHRPTELAGRVELCSDVDLLKNIRRLLRRTRQAQHRAGSSNGGGRDA
jgi:hypothetical protein